MQTSIAQKAEQLQGLRAPTAPPRWTSPARQGPQEPRDFVGFREIHRDFVAKSLAFGSCPQPFPILALALSVNDELCLPYFATFVNIHVAAHLRSLVTISIIYFWVLLCFNRGTPCLHVQDFVSSTFWVAARWQGTRAKMIRYEIGQGTQSTRCTSCVPCIAVVAGGQVVAKLKSNSARLSPAASARVEVDNGQEFVNVPTSTILKNAQTNAAMPRRPKRSLIELMQLVQLNDLWLKRIQKDQEF